jgi:DNA-binding response OmpR family regulator
MNRVTGNPHEKVSQEQSSLKRFRVLVVEDEMLLAMLVEDSLVAFGCDVVGPVARVIDGVKLASSERLDGAILDINIAGTKVFPVASELARRSVPFIFVSGYDAENLPEAWRGRPILKKPFRRQDLARNMRKAFAKSSLRPDQTAD